MTIWKLDHLRHFSSLFFYCCVSRPLTALHSHCHCLTGTCSPKKHYIMTRACKHVIQQRYWTIPLKIWMSFMPNIYFFFFLNSAVHGKQTIVEASNSYNNMIFQNSTSSDVSFCPKPDQRCSICNDVKQTKAFEQLKPENCLWFD